MPRPGTGLDPEGYYLRLGVKPNADRAAIVAAYRGKARILHPDVPKTGNTEAFVAVKQAYDVLSNGVRRDAYDRAARQAAMDAIQPEVFDPAPPPRAAPRSPPPPPRSPPPWSSPPPAPAAARRPRFSDLPIGVWLGLGAFLGLCVIEAVLHLRAVVPPQRDDIRPNAAVVAPLSPSAHQEILYGPAPAHLPGTANFYVAPATGPAVLWQLDRERNALVRMGELPPFSSVQAVRLVRQNGMLEVLVNDQATGFIQMTHLTPGNAEAARRAYCGYNAGATPTDGEVLQRHGSGSDTLELNNRAVQPVVLKLRQTTGSAAFVVFLAPGGHAELRGLPAGTYQGEYAIGELWSRACNTFAAGMRAKRLRQSLTIPNDDGLMLSADSSGAPASDIPDAMFEQDGG